MLNLEMTCSAGCAVIAASGSVQTSEDAETFAAALSFVPVDDHVVVDLADLEHVSADGARKLCAQLLDRVAWAEAVVVSGRPEVAMQLILNDLDHVVPMVPTRLAAIAVIRARSGHRVGEVV